MQERLLCLALEAINGQRDFYTRVGTASILTWHQRAVHTAVLKS